MTAQSPHQDVMGASKSLSASRDLSHAGSSPLPSLLGKRDDMEPSRDLKQAAGVKPRLDDWRPIESAPRNERVLVYFTGAGPIVAYRDPNYPEMWVRYLGYGKSSYWPTVHSDYASHWMPLPPVPATPQPRDVSVVGDSSRAGSEHLPESPSGAASPKHADPISSEVSGKERP